MSIFTLISALRDFDMVKEAEPVIRQTGFIAASLNRDQQRKGKDAFNKNLPRYRSQKYAQAKHARNPLPPFGVWDLWLTGDLQSRFKSAVANGRLKLYSEDDKYEKVFAKVPQAFGLTDESKVKYNNDAVVPGLIKVFKTKTGL